MQVYKGRYLSDLDKFDLTINEDISEKAKRGEVIEMPEEVIRIHSVFFKKSYKKQRETLRMLIWWSIKHYFKILFK